MSCTQKRLQSYLSELLISNFEMNRKSAILMLHGETFHIVKYVLFYNDSIKY